MKKIKVFSREESVSYPGKYIIRVDLDKFQGNSTIITN